MKTYSLIHPYILSDKEFSVQASNSEAAAKKMWRKLSKMYADDKHNISNQNIIFSLKETSQSIDTHTETQTDAEIYKNTISHFRVTEKIEKGKINFTINNLLFDDEKVDNKLEEFSKKVNKHLEQSGGEGSVLDEIKKLTERKRRRHKLRFYAFPRYYFSPAINHIIYSNGISNPTGITVIDPMVVNLEVLPVLAPIFYRPTHLFLVNLL